MTKFEKVKYYYDHNLWSKQRVRDAVVKNWITTTQYKEITNEDY